MSALDKKLTHDKDCHKVSFPWGECTCGAEEAWAELEALRLERTALQDALKDAMTDCRVNWEENAKLQELLDDARKVIIWARDGEGSRYINPKVTIAAAEWLEKDCALAVLKEGG